MKRWNSIIRRQKRRRSQALYARTRQEMLLIYEQKRNKTKRSGIGNQPKPECFDFIEGNKFAVYLFSSALDSGDLMNSALFAMAFRVLKTVEAIFFCIM